MGYDGLHFDEIDLDMLDAQVSHSMLEGGCAYAVEKGAFGTDRTREFRWIDVVYFNVGEAGHPSVGDLSSWGQSFGGAAQSENSIDLPEDFSGWTGSNLQWTGEVSRFNAGSPIPEFTSRGSAQLHFALVTSVVDGLIGATISADGAVFDPTTALANGVSTTYSASFDAVDEKGYSARLEVHGSLSPFTSYVADSLPGEFQAQASATLRGSVTNTTSGRNTTGPSVAFYAVYPLDSGTCLGYDGISHSGDDWTDPSYCIKKLGEVYGAELTPGDTVDIGTVTAPLMFGPFGESTDALKALNAPLAVYAALGYNRGMVQSTWTAETGCLVSQDAAGVWVVPAEGWPDVLCS